MPNNLGMTDAEIIELLGGVTVVARYFEIKPPSVFGWLETGIPEVRLMALAPQLELRSNGRFSRKARWPETYAFFWPELAQAHADHAPDATELISVATATAAVGNNNQGDDEYEQAQEGRHDQQNEDAPLQ